MRSMNNEQFLKVLGLTVSALPSDIKVAFTSKLAELQEKINSVPTDALKQKFQTLVDDLNQANVQFTQATSKASSPLSQTKMADLPGMGEAAATTQKIEAGSTLSNGRYEIKEFIAQGGMGAVYRAQDNNTQQDVVIKIMLPALVASTSAKERFLTEAKLSQKLSHPNIVNVYDVQQDGELVFMSMELLEGQDLRSFIESHHASRQEIEVEETLEIVNSICDALSYAHKHTVHRDIKPENIFLTEDGEVKLMDFGIARVMSSSQHTQTGAAMGTAYYMAPEQIKGRGNVDGRADQYALGVLLYEMLSGEVPTGRIEPLAKTRKGIPAGLSKAVDVALSPKADDRFADMQTFKEAINKKGGGMPALPIKTIGIAAAVVLGIGLVGTIFSSVDFSGLVPESAEVVAQRKAEVAKLQGEIKTYKRRLDNGRRNLDTDIRDAKRENSRKLKAFERWQQLTENYIFNGSALTDLEGELSMGESLLREKSFAPANDTLTKVRDGYKSLWENFNAAEKLYTAERANKLARNKWVGYKQNKNLPSPTEVKQAKQSEIKAKQAMSDSSFLIALQDMQQAKQYWNSAVLIDKQLTKTIRITLKSKNKWLKRKNNYRLKNPTQVLQAEQSESDASSQQRDGDFSQALLHWRQATKHWQAAYNAVENEVATISTQRANALAERKRQVAAERKRKAAAYLTPLIRQAKPKMVVIPSGSFYMGSKVLGREEPIHRVRIGSFKMSETEITFTHWDACVKAKGCDYNQYDIDLGLGNYPVTGVGYTDITQQFIPWLNKVTGKRFRLPTEAEWEYACKAGSTSEYCGSNSIDNVGWYHRNSNSAPHPVRQKQANAFGLYDMSGNVFEWTQDCWNKNYYGAPSNGEAWLSGNCVRRVIRGGSWDYLSRDLRSTYRYWRNDTDSLSNLGFRLAQD